MRRRYPWSNSVTMPNELPIESLVKSVSAARKKANLPAALLLANSAAANQLFAAIN
jgi:hypothetical protein